MALQFRRGNEADLPSDSEVGEPLFTTDSGKLFVRNASGTLVEISGSGSSILADGSVTTAKLAAGAVTNDKITDGTISSTKLGSDITAAGKSLLTASTADDQKTALSLSTVATTGSYADLGSKPVNATTSDAGYMSATDKTKLDGIASGAQVNVKSDWNQINTADDSFIQNKPALGTAAALNVNGTGDAASGEVVKGNDSRLSDARTPTAHKSTHATGGADALSASDIGAAAATHQHSGSDITTGTVATGRLDVGTGSTQVAAGDHTHSLGDLSNVSSATASDGQVLKWNNTAGEWQPGTDLTSGTGSGSVATDTLWDAKGDLAVATGNDTAVRVGVGTHGQVLTADSNATSGVAWSSLGTAAALNVGTAANNVVQLDGTAKLPAVDGSQLTNLPSGVTDHGALTGLNDDDHTQYALADGSRGTFEVSGAVSTHAALTTAHGISTFGASLVDDLTSSDARTTLGLGTASTLDVGTAATNVVQLDANAKLPAVDGSQLTNLPSSGAPTDATYLTLTSNGTLSNQRLFTVGTGLTETDGGAGQAYSIEVDFGSLQNTVAEGNHTHTHTDSYVGHIETPANGDYYIDAYAATARTITGFYAICTSGTCTAVLDNAGSTVVSHTVSSTSGAATGLTNTSVAANTAVKITLSSVNTVAAMRFVVKYTETI